MTNIDNIKNLVKEYKELNGFLLDPDTYNEYVIDAVDSKLGNVVSDIEHYHRLVLPQNGTRDRGNDDLVQELELWLQDAVEK